MSYKDPIQALEAINKQCIDLFCSKEMSIGCSVELHKKLIRRKAFLTILKRFFKRRIEKKIQRASISKNKDVFYNRGNVSNKKKGVVYTCITGKYDCIKEPILLSDNLTYVCFTDLTNLQNKSCWQIRGISKKIFELNGTLVNRYYKMHPFDFFDGYDYAIYIDGNVQTVSDITRLYSIAKESKTGIAMHLHSRRNCVYDEIDACALYKRGNVPAIKRWKTFLEKKMFPKKYGLLEATIIVVDLHNKTAQKLFDDWWENFLDSETKRDQLIFPYVLWKNKLTLNDIGLLGNNVYQNPMFFIKGHQMKELL